MSDLSSLLGDLYGEGEKPPTPSTPDWASDEALDSAFSDWVPGELGGDDPRGKGSILDSPAPATWDIDDDGDGEEWLVGTVAPPPAAAPPPPQAAPAPAPQAAPAPAPAPAPLAPAVAPAPPPAADDPPLATVEVPVAATRPIDAPVEPTVIREPDPEPTVEAAPVAVITRVWHPSDDDILPSKRPRKAKSTPDDTATRGTRGRHAKRGGFRLR